MPSPEPQSRYAWVLGDDDAPAPDALRYVLETTRARPNLALLILNFSSRYRKGELRFARSFEIPEDVVEQARQGVQAPGPWAPLTLEEVAPGVLHAVGYSHHGMVVEFPSFVAVVEAFLDALVPSEADQAVVRARALPHPAAVASDPQVLADERRYGLGVAAFEVGSGYSRQEPLQRIARRPLAELVDRTRQSAHLAVLHGTEILYLRNIDSPHAIRPRSYLGVRMPAFCTSEGRALLADCMAGDRVFAMAQLSSPDADEAAGLAERATVKRGEVDADAGVRELRCGRVDVRAGLTARKPVEDNCK